MPLINKVIKVKNMALVQSGNVDLLKDRLTLTSTGHTPFTLNLYKESDNSDELWVPRALVSKSEVEVEANPYWCLESTLGCFDINFKLRDYQKKVAEDYLNAIDSFTPYGGIVSAYTGFGKTLLSIYLAYQLQYKTLIIVTSNTLLNQWKNVISEFTDCKEEDVGVIKQDKCEVKDKKFVVAMLHSLAMRDYPKWIYSEFGFIIADETHHLSAEVLSKAIFKFHSRYTLGLSATPDRKDGMEKVFLWALGPIVSKCHNKSITSKVFAIPYDNKDTHHEGCIGRYGKFRGKLISSKYLNKLELSKPRIEFIGKILNKLYEKNENTLILSDRVSILKNLKNYLIHIGIKESDVGLFCNKDKETGRKIELATYGCAGEGYDRTDIDNIVLATPRVDIRQAIGRLRKSGKIIDVVDVRSDKITGWFYGRLKHYNKLNCIVENKL